MSANFHLVSTWSSGKGSLPGKKALAAKCSMTPLSCDGIQHHRIVEGGRHLADYLDGFRLKPFQVI